MKPIGLLPPVAVEVMSKKQSCEVAWRSVLARSYKYGYNPASVEPISLGRWQGGSNAGSTYVRQVAANAASGITR